MLRKYMAYYVVEVYSEGHAFEEAGFYPADTFGEVMAYIEEYFGDELCVVKHLELLDSSMMHMTPETAKDIVVYNYG